MIKRGNSKGQVTLFIVIAIVIVAVAALAVIFWPSISSLFMSQQQAQDYLSSQSANLKNAVSDCVMTTSEDGFSIMSLQAGYYDTTGLKTLSYVGNDYIVVMYKDSAKNRINKLPSLGQIENEYKAFLDAEGNDAIDSCLNNLASFKRNMDIELGEKNITASIYYDTIVINVDWPMTLSKSVATGKATKQINQDKVTLLIPLGYMWQTANKVTDCETRQDCKYEGINWDKDAWDNPYRLQYITRDARSLNENQIAFILTSTPYRTGEQEYKFNFGIDRT